MATSRQNTPRRGERAARRHPVLLVALGAVAGIALGMVLADRAGGLDGLLGRGGARGSRRPRQSGWRGDETRSETFDEHEDDDTELSPESIAHMHVHGEGEDGEPAVATAADAIAAGRAAAGPASVAPGAPPRRSFRRREGAAASMSRAAVRGVGPQAPDPAALEARVLEAFLNDPTLQERAIDICAAGSGTIELTGWVQASWEIGHALTLARGVPDVHRVVDRLAVRGGEPARDHSSTRYEPPPAH